MTLCIKVTMSLCWSLVQRKLGLQPESEKPMSHGGIATWKVFARPESFCAYLWNPPLKDMPKCTDFQMVWKVSGLSGKFPDNLKYFRLIWKASRLFGKFPDCLESFGMVWKIFGWSGKFPDCLESYK